MGIYLFALLVLALGILFLIIGLFVSEPSRVRYHRGFLLAGTIAVVIGTAIQLFATGGSLIHW